MTTPQSTFSDFPVPAERHPTSAARVYLSSKLAIQDDLAMQDWERFYADENRIAEFIDLYESDEIDDEERFLLMELILASAEAADEENVTPKIWARIDRLLLHNRSLHERTVWEWADIDEETGIPANDYQISEHMQALFLRMVEESRPKVKSGFSEFWHSRFANHKPASFALRTTLSDRWIRFHSLPGGQRHADSDNDWQTLLERNNELATDVLGNGSRCWLVLPRDIDPENVENDSHLSSYRFSFAFKWTDDSEPSFPYERDVNSTEVVWRPGKFNMVFRAIAGWNDVSMFFVSRETGDIFAPYDGGMDLFLQDPAATLVFRAKYADWLPDNPAGL